MYTHRSTLLIYRRTNYINSRLHKIRSPIRSGLREFRWVANPRNDQISLRICYTLDEISLSGSDQLHDLPYRRFWPHSRSLLGSKMLPKCFPNRFPKTSLIEKHKNAKSHYLLTFLAVFRVPLGPQTVSEWTNLRAKRLPKTRSEK